MSGSKKDWGHGKKTSDLKIKSQDKELKTKIKAARNPNKEKDSPMSTPV